MKSPGTNCLFTAFPVWKICIFQAIDYFVILCYSIFTSVITGSIPNALLWLYFRACTGFDGGFEVVEAIRGPGPRKNLDLKLNADDNLALAA